VGHDGAGGSARWVRFLGRRFQSPFWSPGKPLNPTPRAAEGVCRLRTGCLPDSCPRTSSSILDTFCILLKNLTILHSAQVYPLVGVVASGQAAFLNSRPWTFSNILIYFVIVVTFALIYRSCTLPPRLPPGVFVLLAHGGRNFCFKKPRCGPYYLIFLAARTPNRAPSTCTRAAKLGESSDVFADLVEI
jgi:hypothetical protein